jgi:hypothetical protein
MSASCECYVLSGRRLCDRPIPRPEESYLMFVPLSVIKGSNNFYAHNVWVKRDQY